MKYITKYDGIAIGLTENGEFIAVGTGLRNQTMIGIKKEIEEYEAKGKKTMNILVKNWTNEFRLEKIKVLENGYHNEEGYYTFKVFFEEGKRQHWITFNTKSPQYNNYFVNDKKNRETIEEINSEVEEISKIAKERDNILKIYEVKIDVHRNRIKEIEKRLVPLSPAVLMKEVNV